MKKLLLLFVSICVSCLSQAANYLCFTANEDNSSIGMQAVTFTDTLSALNADVHFSVDGGVSWLAVQPNKMITLNKGDKIYLYGENLRGFSESGRWNQFLMTGSISASGSVMSLIDAKGETTVIPNAYCFERLFMDCKALTQAPELTATKLTEKCYSNMFFRCTKLSSAPELPASELAEGCYADMFCQCSGLKNAPALSSLKIKKDCYLNMFSNCISLAEAPALPATQLAENCYYYMFNNCSSLKATPDLPATSLAPNCYTFMFQNCTGLTKGPKSLPAMELSSACYRGMFEGCTALVEAPELPSNILADLCYWEMFYGCTSLKKAPYLPATETKSWSYYQMFQLCSSLSYIEVALPTWNLVDNNTYSWVKNVASTGKFVGPIALEEKIGESYIPGGWNLVHSNSVDDHFATDDVCFFSLDGQLFVISSVKGKANIFSLGGQILKSVSYEIGLTDLGAFPAGVYVVNGRKVVVK